jgi:hypothetical protein
MAGQTGGCLVRSVSAGETRRLRIARPDGAGRYLLELEAVEPMLYMELAPGASQRFADAVLAS